MKKKGLSGVITVVIMIALVMVAATIVWGVVNNILKNKLGEAKSCFDLFGKITINNMYTCYNPDLNEVQFSISIGDLNVDELIILISSEGATKNFRITNTASQITGLTNYPDGSSEIKLPEKNSGLTYTASGFNQPDSIEIIPIISGEQCDAVDSLYEIDDCSLLA